MEQQHPIPQQISAYQFRLVGDMTLKQFFQVAGGALVALLLYSSNLPPYVKWPLIVFSFLFGVALAFFPLEDRPLAKWLVLFFKAIYSPTLYSWKKTGVKISYFAPEPEEVKTANAVIDTQTPLTTMQVNTPGVEITPESKKLEKQEQEFLTSVSKQLITTPDIKIPLQAIKNEVVVPITKATKVEYPKKEPTEISSETYKTGESTPSFLSPQKGFISQETQAVQFSPAAAPPTPPIKPNILVGQVIDSQGNILENTILEVRDSEGRSVRALKSNKLGHFMIVTPLIDGTYEIITEKEGYVFDPLRLDVRGEIIPPIGIRAKSREASENNPINTNVK